MIDFHKQLPANERISASSTIHPDLERRTQLELEALDFIG